MTTTPARHALADTRSSGAATPGPAGSPARRRWLHLLPAWAGIGYLAAWIGGLAAWPANLALTATGNQVASAYRAHPAGAATQYALSEGLAGLLLGVVLAAAVISNRDRGRLTRPWLPATAAAGGAVAISLLQAAIGMFLITAATGHDNSRAGELSNLVNHLDGVKMLALAAVAAYLSARSGDRRAPAWLRATAALAAAALAASGVTYLLLANSLAWTVYISGPLLLAWITATGIWLTRSSRTAWRAGESA